MRSPSGRRVRVHGCRSGFLLYFVHSMRSQHISRINHRLAETIQTDSLLQLLELLQLEIYFFGLLSLRAFHWHDVHRS